jgi:uncharacterized protein YcnI
MNRLAATTVALLLGAVVADAHVTVWPRESKAGASEKYAIRVPTEGKVTTTSIELEVPPGATIASIEAPSGFQYSVKRDGDRIVSVTWTMDIKPGEFREFVFLARNPKEGGEIVWKVRQRYADGTSSDWIGATGSRQPAPVTKLTAG